MTDRASIVEDFWLAITRNYCPGAEAAATHIKAPLVSVSGTYSFELVKGEEQQAEMIEEGTGTLAESPRAVMPDTPVAMVNTWNAEAGILLDVVSRRETCGARVSDSKVNVLACAGMLERPGGGGCG
jgi:hypothetical protein